MNEAAKAIKRRWLEDDGGKFPWRRILSGRGLDVGCGPDKLPLEECEGFDLKDGDANRLSDYFPRNSFNYIHSSQSLEHMIDPAAALDNWLSLLRPHGHVIVTVPDWCLYEHMVWPSQYNPDHKSTWSMWLKGSPAPIHCKMPEWLKQFNVHVHRCELIDTNYDYHIPFSVDQTWKEENGVEAFIEFVIQRKSKGRAKRLPQPTESVKVMAEPPAYVTAGYEVPAVNENRFLHSGDLGDIIAALPVIRQLGGGRLITTDHHAEGQRPRGTMKDRTILIKDLLEQQSYISGVEFMEKPERITHDFTTFRTRAPFHDTLSLSHWQGRHFGISEVDLDVSPWLNVLSAPHDRVVVARSPRYHNPLFPWENVVRKFKERITFIGTEDEHKAFCEYVKFHVTYQPTKDLLEAARIINGAGLGFYNQSCPCWIALGLGKKLVQETYAAQPNTMIDRPNTYYTPDEYGLWSVTAGLEQA